MNTEPALTIGTTTALVASVLTLLVAFGYDMSDGQRTAVLGVVAALGPIVAAAFTRRKVTPV